MRQTECSVRYIPDYKGGGGIPKGVSTIAPPLLKQHDNPTIFWSDLASFHYSNIVSAWYKANGVTFLPKDTNPQRNETKAHRKILDYDEEGNTEAS